MIALAVVTCIVVAALAVVATNALNQARLSYDRVHEAELSMRTHLQAQVDDLHAKVLSHNWTEYGNTVGQRSAFDRAIAAESERMQQAFGTSEGLDEALERLNGGAFYDDAMEGPTVG